MDSTVADSHAMNVGPGQNVSVSWIAAKIGSARTYRASRVGDIGHTLAGDRQAKRALGCRFRIRTDVGLN
jgi:hypothetical protein